MRNEVILKWSNAVASDKLLKTTSLIYFKEALVHQQYEDCRGLVRLAKEYGARPSEIRKVIAEHLARESNARRTRTNTRYGGRLSSY
jgi:hypothetical protein